MCVRERERERERGNERGLTKRKSIWKKVTALAVSLSFSDPAAAAAKPHKSILIKVRGFGSFSA